MTPEAEGRREVMSRAGVRVPRIIYGTAWKKAQTQPLVERALELGFRGIDTAAQPKHYDEAAVGRALAAAIEKGVARENLYVQTKFTPLPGHDPARVPYDSSAELGEQVAQSFAGSLRNLGRPVDALVLHSPMPDAGRLAEVWSAMEAIVDDGGARQLGISNCYSLAYLEHLYATARIKPAIVQNRFYAETGYDVAVRGFCAASSIVYQSFWTLTANPDLLAAAAISRAADAHGVTPAQALFRYLTQAGVVPLTGTRSETHMREGLAIFDFDLTESERGSITAWIERAAEG